MFVQLCVGMQSEVVVCQARVWYDVVVVQV